MRHSGPGSSRLLIILKVCFIDNIIIAKIILHDILDSNCYMFIFNLVHTMLPPKI